MVMILAFLPIFGFFFFISFVIYISLCCKGMANSEIAYTTHSSEIRNDIYRHLNGAAEVKKKKGVKT